VNRLPIDAGGRVNLGSGLLVPVTALFGWIDHEWPKIEHSRRQYDAGMKSRLA